ncbi:MAG: hypothetical protein RJB26_917 [Pseudomonadota bacterium]
MAAGNVISCKQFASFLVSQEPVYDKEVLKDIRPFDGLIGYYQTGSFDAYSGTQHTFDRFNSVFPNVTTSWDPVSGASCSGTPCDPTENKIGWGWTRNTYALEKQSWGSDILCFDQIMTKTKAKEHFRQIIDDVLRPATNWITTYYLQRKAMELGGSLAGGNAFACAAGLPAINFAWVGAGYTTLRVTDNAGVAIAAASLGRLTPEILQSRVTRQYFLGAIQAGKEGFDSLQLHTDKDTFRYLQKTNATLYDAWRFGVFAPAAKEFYKYGFMGFVGDFMVKVLQFPLKFNATATPGNYTLVLPYKNVAATEGIRSIFNEDYDKAQFQISYINNPRSLRVLPFRPEAVNPNMPFMVRDYGGRWKFATNDLGADCAGKPIDNARGNKGKFIADFQLAVKPEHPEWLEPIFHKVDRGCIEIIPVCEADPGNPAQSYNSADPVCAPVVQFEAVANDAGNFVIGTTGIMCNDNIVTNAGISEATPAALVAALQVVWDAEFGATSGTWSVVSGNTIQLAGSSTETVPCTNVTLEFSI